MGTRLESVSLGEGKKILWDDPKMHSGGENGEGRWGWRREGRRGGGERKGKC